MQVGSMETLLGIKELMLSFPIPSFSTLDRQQKEASCVVYSFLGCMYAQNTYE